MAADIVWNFLSFIVALGILVTVHEFGHFWVARKCGVEVKRFSIGFGKVLWRRTDKHGTEFVIALIPLGGYVQMLDGRVDDVTLEQQSRAFNYKSVYQRIAIIAAGPLANFVFAVFAFYLMFLIGVPSIKAVVGEVSEQSIAAQAGIQSKHQVVAVNQKQTSNWQEVNLQLIAAIGNKSLEIQTKQFDSQYVKKHQLNTALITFKPEQESPLTTLGITPFMPEVHAAIASVQEGKPGALAGMQAGDVIVAINGQPTNVDGVNNWQLFANTIAKNANKAVTVELLRDNKLISVVVTPQAIKSGGNTRGFIGVAPKVDPWPEAYQFEIQYGFFDAIGKSIEKTWQLIVLSFEMIGKLITGDVSIKNLSGPVSIAQGAGNSASYGLVYFLSFLALISINLGIINLLPLPVLDGGHLFYYLVEIITGKPVPEKIQVLGFKFGTIALITLMAVAIFNDIARF